MHITLHYDYAPDDFKAMRVADLADMVLREQGCPENTECSISFVSNECIAELNETYRGKVGPTDVLSFECDGVSDGFLVGEDAEPFELGDIVIASDIAASQAKDYGNTVREEVELLCVHGLLHLCGMDHVHDAEAEAMEARERELLCLWRSRS